MSRLHLSQPRPASSSPTSVVVAGILTLFAFAALGCAQGGDPDGGGPPDSGLRDSGVMMDSSFPRDSGPDPCDGVVCDILERCVRGACERFPACGGDGSCLESGQVCRNRVCMPLDHDADGDGHTAETDCDETNPSINPEASEICGIADEDCDGNIDEGDPAELCATNPGGGICDMSSCGCPEGTFDLDRDIPGCECVAMPALNEGLTCGDPIVIPAVADNGQVQTVTGNIMPDDREVWYRVRAVDRADTSCDNFHFRVQFTRNPNNTFEMNVQRGDCTGFDDLAFVDYTWATDFRAMVDDRLAGECPCWVTGGTPMANVSQCQDNSAEFFIRVRRRVGSMLACDEYELEISNGVYDT